MKTNIILLFSLLLLSAFTGEQQGTVNLSITNIKQAGTLHIGLYRAGDEFPGDKFRVQGVQKDCKGDCSVTFEAVPFGDYAVAVFQDVNGNNKLDTGLFGIPSEPFAFSNNFRPKFGGPTFEKCKFTLSAEKLALDIQLINSLFGGN